MIFKSWPQLTVLTHAHQQLLRTCTKPTYGGAVMTAIDGLRSPWQSAALTMNSLQIVLSGAFAALTIAIPTTSQSNESLRDQLNIDESKLDRSDGRNSYAAVIDRVSPSVVSVFTRAKVPAPNMDLYRDLFHDPFFRHFFGDPSDREPPTLQPERAPVPQYRSGVGSGVILTSDGYIVTNFHVIDGAEEIQVQLKDDREIYEAKLIGSDRATDLALLKIDADDLPAAQFGDSSQLQVGDVVLAIGNPFGLDQTVTSGIVSALGRRNLAIAGYENFIQTDASINPGNSGGPLIDTRGRVVGVSTAIVSHADGGAIGIGFAIPVNMAVDILDQLLEDGEITRGFLGVKLSDLTPDLAEGFGVEPKGALVNEVMADTPAERAGLEPGDVIVRFDGHEVIEMSGLRLMVASTEPGSKATVEIIRDGKPHKLTVEIETLPAEVAGTRDLFLESPDSSQQLLDGVEISDLTMRIRMQFGIPDEIAGVVVTSIDPNSAAFRAGLREGEVILSVARQAVESVDEAIEACSDASAKVVLLQVVNGEGTRFVAVAKAP